MQLEVDEILGKLCSECTLIEVLGESKELKKKGITMLQNLDKVVTYGCFPRFSVWFKELKTRDLVKGLIPTCVSFLKGTRKSQSAVQTLAWTTVIVSELL